MPGSSSLCASHHRHLQRRRRQVQVLTPAPRSLDTGATRMDGGGGGGTGLVAAGRAKTKLCRDARSTELTSYPGPGPRWRSTAPQSCGRNRWDASVRLCSARSRAASRPRRPCAAGVCVCAPLQKRGGWEALCPSRATVNPSDLTFMQGQSTDCGRRLTDLCHHLRHHRRRRLRHHRHLGRSGGVRMCTLPTRAFREQTCAVRTAGAYTAQV
jgi:hypothetical protein